MSLFFSSLYFFFFFSLCFLLQNYKTALLSFQSSVQTSFGFWSQFKCNFKLNDKMYAEHDNISFFFSLNVKRRERKSQMALVFKLASLSLYRLVRFTFLVQLCLFVGMQYPNSCCRDLHLKRTEREKRHLFRSTISPLSLSLSLSLNLGLSLGLSLSLNLGSSLGLSLNSFQDSMFKTNLVNLSAMNASFGRQVVCSSKK